MKLIIFTFFFFVLSSNPVFPESLLNKSEILRKSDECFKNSQHKVCKDLISEIEELKEASSNDEKKYELGDVLFSLVNVSRYIEADPEIQLKKSTERFINRAKYVESNKDDNSDIEKLWLEAKKDEIG